LKQPKVFLRYDFVLAFFFLFLEFWFRWVAVEEILVLNLTMWIAAWFCYLQY